jgi:hypothetical protein
MEVVEIQYPSVQEALAMKEKLLFRINDANLQSLLQNFQKKKSFQASGILGILVCSPSWTVCSTVQTFE